MYVGLDAPDVVNRLRSGGFLGFAQHNPRYMRIVARYLLRRNKVVIRTDDCEHFLLDLDHYGFLQIATVDA